MVRYRLSLYRRSNSARATQSVELEHDSDALDLAQIALLSTADYTHAEVYRDDALIGAIERDSTAALKHKSDNRCGGN